MDLLPQKGAPANLLVRSMPSNPYKSFSERPSVRAEVMYTAASLLSFPKRLFLNTIRTATSYPALDESARLVFAFVVTSEGNLLLLMVVICPDVALILQH